MRIDMFEIFNIIIKEDNIFQLQEITVVPQASVPGASNLISRNEEILVEARRNYYEEVKQKKLNKRTSNLDSIVVMTIILNLNHLKLNI